MAAHAAPKSKVLNLKVRVSALQTPTFNIRQSLYGTGARKFLTVYPPPFVLYTLRYLLRPLWSHNSPRHTHNLSECSLKSACRYGTRRDQIPDCTPHHQPLVIPGLHPVPCLRLCIALHSAHTRRFVFPVVHQLGYIGKVACHLGTSRFLCYQVPGHGVEEKNLRLIRTCSTRMRVSELGYRSQSRYIFCPPIASNLRVGRYTGHLVRKRIIGR